MSYCRLAEIRFVTVLGQNDEQLIPNLTQTFEARQQLDLAPLAWPVPRVGTAQQGRVTGTAGPWLGTG